MVMRFGESIFSRNGELDLVARRFKNALLQHPCCQRVVDDENRRRLSLGFCRCFECLAPTALGGRHKTSGV